MYKRIINLCLVMLMLIFSCTANVSAKESSVPNIAYKSHVQNIGWMEAVNSGITSGTTGKGYRLEAMKIQLIQNGKSMVRYRTHVQNIGWQDWVDSDKVTGTTGKSYRIEAIQIKLKGTYADKYDVCYRVHVADFGWLGWTKNGNAAGSTGIGAQVEAIQIKLVQKGGGTASKSAFINPTVNYTSHVANIGWMSPVSQEQISGTTGQSRQLEAFVINLEGTPGNSNIQYKAHVSDIGWQGWKSVGNVAGTSGQSKAVEAIQIRLTGALSSYYNIYYRVHTSNIGWLGWAKNGASAGTTGGRFSIEAIQIKIVPKGTTVDVGGVAYYDKSSTRSGFDPIWPCENTYTITTLYRYPRTGGVHLCRYKYGIDIGAPKGENVLAVEDGTVICSEYSTSSGFGNYIKIRHTNGKVSLYAHLNSRNVMIGQSVTKGQIIGQVGNTSATNKNMGVHLHFELGNSDIAGAAGDAYQEYYKTKYASKIRLTEGVKMYCNP